MGSTHEMSPCYAVRSEEGESVRDVVLTEKKKLESEEEESLGVSVEALPERQRSRYRFGARFGVCLPEA